MKTIIISIVFNICLPCIMHAQRLRAFDNNVTEILEGQGNSHGLFKTTLVFGLNKGFSIGASYGLWNESPALQYSLNTGFMWRFQKGFLGNYRDDANPDDSRSKGQFIFMFSPMLSINFSRKNYFYQELEPFYLGTPNAVFSKYKYSLTLGSTFTISPRGTYKNITTSRNRAQQVFMFGLNLKDFNFTLYDDYFPKFTDKLQLGDNWDRFFTGGGFIRYRFSSEYTLHVYSEVYTGINRANAFLNPDIISYKPKKKNWLLKNYANQDAGQEYFNYSWFIVKLSYTSLQRVTSNSGLNTPDIDFLVGTTAPWTMFSQNVVHSSIHYDDSNSLRLHYFLPRSNVPGNLEMGNDKALSWIYRKLFYGAGIQSNVLLP